jgi:hypothetical protein
VKREAWSVERVAYLALGVPAPFRPDHADIISHFQAGEWQNCPPEIDQAISGGQFCIFTLLSVNLA